MNIRDTGIRGHDPMGDMFSNSLEFGTCPPILEFDLGSYPEDIRSEFACAIDMSDRYQI